MRLLAILTLFIQEVESLKEETRSLAPRYALCVATISNNVRAQPLDEQPIGELIDTLERVSAYLNARRKGKSAMRWLHKARIVDYLIYLRQDVNNSTARFSLGADHRLEQTMLRIESAIEANQSMT